MGREQVNTFQNPEVGIVEAVSTMKRNDVPYNGCKIKLDGETLYVTGTGDEVFRIGDEVYLSITEHPFKPLKTLMINIMGVSR